MNNPSEDLRKVIETLSQEVRGPRPKVSPSIAPAAPPPHIPALFLGTGAGALLSLTGLLVGSPHLALLGSLGSFLGILALGWCFWNKRLPFLRHEAQDIAVEVLKRRSVELERDRLMDELGYSHHLIRGLNEKLLNLQQELTKEKADRAETVAQKEAKMQEDFEAEKKKWAETFQREISQREKSLEQFASQKISHLQHKLETQEQAHAQNRLELEKQLEHISQKAVRLQQTLDEKTVAQSAELAAHVEHIRKAHAEEKEALEKNLQEQEAHYRKQFAEQEHRFNAQRTDLLSACEAFLREVEEKEKRLKRR